MSIQAETTDNRQTALPVKDREVIQHKRGPFTDEELAFAKQEGLRRLAVRYVLTTKPRSETFIVKGHTFRSAGNLCIRTGRDGELRFTAYMHEDSVDQDFLYFDRVIDNAMGGRMDGWTRHTFKDGSEGWLLDYSNYQCDQLTFKPADVIIGKQSESDAVVGFGTAWGYPCEETMCQEKYHELGDGHHTFAALENVFTNRCGYEIEITKNITQPDSDWSVNVWTGPDLTDLTSEQIATFAGDLQRMGAECDAANGRSTSARTIRRDASVDERLREMDS